MAAVKFLQISLVVVVVGFDLIGPSDAFKYYVGGKDGWSLKPSVSFNHWASQCRFQVHDSLIFKYKHGTDSVLQVDQDHYNSCNKTNPILALENNGDSSTFNINHSGLFFFISGHSDHCNKGQKIIILVMAPRNASPTPAPSPAPIPFQRTSPVISPAASPGPSQAPPPDDGRSASASALGGDLVLLVLLFWIIFN